MAKLIANSLPVPAEVVIAVNTNQVEDNATHLGLNQLLRKIILGFHRLSAFAGTERLACSLCSLSIASSRSAGLWAPGMPTPRGVLRNVGRNPDQPRQIEAKRPWHAGCLKGLDVGGRFSRRGEFKPRLARVGACGPTSTLNPEGTSK